MTETRKEIIGLIEPYMEKDLSEGCLLYFDLDIYRNILEEDSDGCVILTPERDGVVRYSKRDINKTFKILGHYDMTAVTKMINKKGYYSSNYSMNIIEFSLKENEDFDFEFSIKNKPLHLYSEQEEKDLLALLTKLK